LQLAGVEGWERRGISESSGVFSVHEIGAHESNELEEAAGFFADLLQGVQQKKATAIWMRTAFSDLPTNFVILSVCFISRKNSSICQRRL
jgi:hypothetical protein